MLVAKAFAILLVGVLNAETRDVQPGAAYSLPQVVRLIKDLHDGLLDQSDLDGLLSKRGIAFELNLANILQLQANGIKNAELIAIEGAARHTEKIGGDNSGAPSLAGNKGKVEKSDQREAAPVATKPTPPTNPITSEKPPQLKGFFSSGAKFLNPYNVRMDSKGGYGVLDTTGSSTVPYLEFAYMDRFASRNLTELDPGRSSPWTGYPPSFEPPFVHFPDVDFRLGFTFPSGQETAEYSTATLAGSGDFYGEASVGFPFFRMKTSTVVQQLSLDFAGGVTTQKDFFEAHPNLFVGVGYQVGFPAHGIAETSPRGFLITRLGYGALNTPRTSAAGSNVVVSASGGIPKFDLKGSLAWGAFVVYPITSSLYLSIGGNVYPRTTPAPWNVTAGVTIPLGKVSDVFKPLLGNDSR